MVKVLRKNVRKYSRLLTLDLGEFPLKEIAQKVAIFLYFQYRSQIRRFGVQKLQFVAQKKRLKTPVLKAKVSKTLPKKH